MSSRRSKPQTFSTKRDRERADGLDELAAMTQDMGGYPELDE